MREWGNSGAVSNVFWPSEANPRTRKAAWEGREAAPCVGVSAPWGLLPGPGAHLPTEEGPLASNTSRVWQLVAALINSKHRSRQAGLFQGVWDSGESDSCVLPPTLSQPLPQSHLCLGACTGTSLPGLDVASTPFLKHGNPIPT